jgi:hypothetical protein
MINPEKKEDLENEIAVIKEFGKAMKCEYQKLPKFDVDFLLARNGKVVAFAEVKCRTHSFNAFPTQMLSFTKYYELDKFGKNFPCFFICRYTDGIYYIESKEIPLDNIEKGGREPRPHRPNDIEYLIHFDRSLMKQIKT